MLQTENTTTLTNEDCRALYGPNIKIPGNVICAQGFKFDGVCWLDAGGPLVVGDLLVGVNMWVSQYSPSHPSPRLHARVSNYLSWINSRVD